MKRNSEVIARISVIALVTIALVLAFSLLPDLYTDSGPNLATVIGIFVAVIVCASLGSWIALTGETKHETLLVISLFLGSGLAFLLSIIFAVDLGASSPGWMELHPSAVHNLSVTANCLFALTAILAVEAFAVLIHIVRAGRE